MKIKANNDEIKEVSNNMKNQGDLFEQELEKLNKQIDILETIWIGTDSQTFVKSVRNYLNKLIAIPDTLRVINKFMVQSKDQLFDKDNQFGNRVNMNVDYHNEGGN